MKQTRPPELRDAEVLAVSKRGDRRHRVLKITRDDCAFVVKCYGRKSGRFRAAMRQLGSVTFAGKSSVTPRARQRTERRVLELWRQEGFDVPGEIRFDPPESIGTACLAMEWIPGPTLAGMLRSARIALDRKKALISDLASTLGRRHARAVELREPRLVFEHPTLDHLIVSQDRLVHFDFEIVFTRRNLVERLVRRELAGILHSLAKTGGDDFSALLDVFVDSYPDRGRLALVLRELEKYRAVPIAAWLGTLQRFLRGWKRYNKRFVMVRALEAALIKSNERDGRCETRRGPGRNAC